MSIDWNRILCSVCGKEVIEEDTSQICKLCILDTSDLSGNYVSELKVGVHVEKKKAKKKQCQVCSDSGIMGDGHFSETMPCNYCERGFMQSIALDAKCVPCQGTGIHTIDGFCYWCNGTGKRKTKGVDSSL